MRENELLDSRLTKLNYVKTVTNPYPERFEITHEIVNAAKLPDGENGIKCAGRIIFMRKMGKMSFINIADIYGKIQIAIKKDEVGEEVYNFFKKGFDVGDFIGVGGEIFTTQTGEKTLRAKNIQFLGKSLKTLPEKFHGVTNTEICYRQRYLDLCMNEDSKKRFLDKFRFIKEIRRFLEDRNYMEIETPVLIDHPSGASARPFVSQHNALNMDVYLRIAPETYLKRAIVGGFTKVFEFARCFRNEGIDTTHLQDFTMLEAYCAYYNYRDNMKFIQEMLKLVVEKIWGTTRIKVNGNVIDFADDWEIISFRDLLLRDCEIDINKFNTPESLLEEIKIKSIDLSSEVSIENMGLGNLIDVLYKKVSRPKIIAPTFLIDHPKDLSPLARANDENSEIVDRFQLIINGAEVINAYSELVDPMEQKKRLMEQARCKAQGDEEAMMMDEDYIEAMEYGMPPISGWGMGIDRIFQVITGQDNIKDTILFPLMKPKF
ncbi:lysine--tRNA ligase [Clostridium butyricum]|uniref:lysine--tRNA ligase n=1 Tax=Clostridium butyricum TaxID=1492 RepID=UPI0022E9617F|nr:lysine--tRNA ligase [Clostridium butyricum]